MTTTNELYHHGIKGQKWGKRNGPPYPLDADGKLKSVNKLNDLMNSEWEYGVLYNGKRIGEDELSNFDWGKDYRTIPIRTLEKEKIGTCWDYVNYQHDKLDGMGIKNDSYLLFIQRNPDKAEDSVTHTFTVFEPGDGKKYWLESAAWPKRGVHEISGVEDVVKEMNDLYGNKGFGYSLFKYDPKGTDKGLTGDEFVERATVDENYVMDEPGKYSYLEHHGIKGQKWGIRRYQNPDGSRTALGKKRARKHTVFVSGSSKTQSSDSEYYRKELPSEIQNELNRYITNGNKVIVGDAPGIDRQVQEYLNKLGYSNVEVYGPGKQVRYTANKKWKTNPIDAPEFEEGSKEWLAKKDIVMSKVADEGLAVILDEGAKATRKNVERLINDNKDVKVYELNKSGSDFDKWVRHDDIEDDQKYGIPELKKFPMPDADHVISAIKFFNYVTPAYEKELASAILKHMKEYGMTFDDFNVGKENRFSKYIPENYLEHHGIKGQRWGIRRYQNPDGTYTEAGLKRLHKKDVKWAKRNYNKIYNSAYKKSKKEMNKFVKKNLNKRMPEKTARGQQSKAYINEYNKKLAELMNQNVSDLKAPSGDSVRFVAKRGEMGVHLALAGEGFDMSTVRNGVYESGRVAYKKNSVNVER